MSRTSLSVIALIALAMVSLLVPLAQADTELRIIERQLTYNPATKEYKVVSLNGEDREAFMTKQLRDAQRVLSELRAGKLAPDAALDPRELYFVRVRADVSLNGVNSWIARFSGEAAETGWVQSPLLTPTRRQ